jgi:hypothetical protein
MSVPFQFPKVDVKKDIAELELDKMAKLDGQKNLPQPQRKVFDATEEKIKGYYVERLTNDSRKAHSDATRLKQDIHNLGVMPLITRINNFNQETSNWFNEKEKETKDFEYFTNKAIDDANKEYQTFRSKHNRLQDAVFPESRRFHFSIVAALIFFEILFNAFFFKEVTSKGIVGGMSISVYIAFLNVVIGFFFGWLILTYKNHIKSFFRNFTYLGIGIFSLYSLFVNFFAAHFREAVHCISLDKHKQEWNNIFCKNLTSGESQQLVPNLPGIFNNLIKNTFAFYDPISIALLTIGIVFAIIAVIDGYKSDDRYPNYGKVQRRRDGTIKKYANNIWIYIESCREEKNRRIETIEENISNVRLKHKTIKYMLDIYLTFDRSYKLYVQQLESACHQSLHHYRAENMRNRTDNNFPKYFEDKFIFSNIPQLNIDAKDEKNVFENMKNFIDNLQDNEKQIIDHTQQCYKRAISKFPHIFEFDKK